MLGFIFTLCFGLLFILIGWAKHVPHPKRGSWSKSNTIYAGAQTEYRFKGNKLVDRNGIEVKTMSFKEWNK
jgi:hypothetical protein